MTIKVFEHIKGGKLPSDLVKILKDNPETSFRITLVPEQELGDGEMPPEERISAELIESVSLSEKEMEAGRITRCETEQDRDAFFKKAFDE
ncbi:hypothetical protein UR09_02390 [Candidatus Nitromaritima sp. SCGC AAA799-A02]|nr:hypothetical protein UZ36_03355 [Candidatus Nitromaritima sp. SCGC AAA799-C22]KMP11838.1 hypothetical protein UR09_02390 [Candidatus Nitromaritima sp. SCGC AAA799-A02]